MGRTIFFSRFEFHKWNVFGGETLVANPLGVDLLREEVERGLGQSGTNSMKPEITSRLAEDGLIIVIHFFVADTTRINRRRRRVLRVEDHRLAGRIHLVVGHH